MKLFHYNAHVVKNVENKIFFYTFQSSSKPFLSFKK